MKAQSYRSKLWIGFQKELYGQLLFWVLTCSFLTYIPSGLFAEEQHPSVPAAYKLKIGDKLLISLYTEPLSKKITTVDPSGSISFLFVNTLPVVGKTIEEVRTELTDRLTSYYQEPILIINGIEFFPDSYTILGEVNAPGRRRIKGTATILSAIADAGSFTNRFFREETIDMENLDRSFLSRRGEYIPVDFNRLIKYGDMSQDIILEPGDYIHIATAMMNKVYVLGSVNAPTSINYYFDTITLAQAVAEAGGLGLNASSRVAVIRGALSRPTRFLIDINRILKGYACDFPLRPGDIVYVPEMRFTTVKEIVKMGIRSFISIAANVAGNTAFLEMTPAAIGDNITSPVPVFNSGGTVIVPVAAPATGGL
jgi:polysaccharide export outer membrane protein